MTHLPDSIGSLVSLTRLFIGDNQLAHLPDSIGDLTTLRYLYVGDNPVTSTEQGRTEVKRRFKKNGLSVELHD